MAVIITDMDMPKYCDTCNLFEVCDKRDIYNENYKSKDCPLKSVEDIKAELQKKEFYVDSTQLAKNVYQEAILDAIEIIDKHIGRK